MFSPAGLRSCRPLCLPEDSVPKSHTESSEGQPGRQVQTRAPQFQPKALALCPCPPCPHSPVEFIVVVVGLPPEVQPGECEAKGEGEKQEPEALPLEDRARRGSNEVRG